MKTQTINLLELPVSQKAEVSEQDGPFKQQIEKARLKKQDFMPLFATRHARRSRA